MLTSYSLDRFVAPELSKLTACGAPELPAREGEWLSRFALGTIFHNRVGAPHKLYSFSYLRKVEAAIEEYQMAHGFLLRYVDGGRRTSDYFRSLRHFENCLAMAYQAMLIVQAMAKQAGEKKGPKFFEQGDGSLLERINRLYNDSKHIDGAIVRGDFPHDEATLVIWLANDRIRSKACDVAYQELHEFLLELAKWAGVVATQTLPEDPATTSS
ncbi:MAG TPA: hypothetical protein VMV10_29510 [Pirellulales bacterium]|nr:hypothetical protein [Pirellulales bacterium]